MLRYHKEDLSPSASVASFLDDVWIPEDILREVSGASPATLSMNSVVMRAQRRALNHSLLYSRQVIVNRAYVANNPLMRSLWTNDGDATHLLQLMASDRRPSPALLVYLFEEGDASAFQPNDPSLSSAWHAFWRRCHDGEDYAGMRLNWIDGTKNKKQTTELAGVFRDFFQSADQRLDLEQLGQAFGLDAEQQRALMAKLARASTLANGEERFTRVTLYNDPMLLRGVPRDVDTDYRAYTPSDIAFKALVDIRYGCNLSDYIDRFGVMGQGTRDRNILQENEDMIPGAAPGTPEDLTQICENFVRRGARRDLPHIDLADLSLSEVLELRSFDTWKDYVAAAEKLLHADARPMSLHPAMTHETTDQIQTLFNEFWGSASAAIASVRAARRMEQRVGLLLQFVGVGLKMADVLIEDSSDAKITLQRIGMTLDLASAAYKGGGAILVSLVFGGRTKDVRTHELKLPILRIAPESPRDFFSSVKRNLLGSREAVEYNQRFDVIGPEHRDADKRHG